MQDTGSLLLGLALNKWLILAVASCVFSFVVRLLLGPVHGQDIAGLSLAPVLAGVMVILIGQALFIKPAPGNNWALSWEWRIDQVLLLFTALGWGLGLLLDLMRRPMSLSLMFGLIAGLGYSIAFLILLVPTGPSLPELFSKTMTFCLLLTFIVWRFAQTDPGYTVLRSLQLAVAAVGAAAVGFIMLWAGREAVLTGVFVLAFAPAFLVALLMWTGVGRGSSLGAAGLFGGLSPFLLFIGHLVLVEEAMSLYAGALIVLMLTGPDLVSGFERRSGINADRIPVWNRIVYLAVIFVLYVALVFIAGLDARG
ncbi:MAG: hypothetical protein CME02_03015 [Geminicoccus sp.]|nr:hypothetical protein [Geminicoccus sp.]